MTPKRDDFRVLVNPPDQLNANYLRWAERMQSSEGCTWGVEAIDKKVIPLRAGQMAVIVARPGHAKTSIMMYLAKQEAARIVARGTQETECVVYVSWEESSEELTKMLMPPAGYTITDLAWGRVPLDIIRQQTAKISTFPRVWIIGHSTEKAKRGKRAPIMTPDAVLSSVETMKEDYGISPSLMMFDHLQEIPIPNSRNRVEEITEVVKGINDLGMRIGCPVYLGSQAKESVDERDNKMPTMSDSQWTSKAFQGADQFYGLLRPVQYLQESQIGKEVYPFSDGRNFIINSELLILRMCKQRGDLGVYTWPLYFDPATLKMGELQARTGGVDF